MTKEDILRLWDRIAEPVRLEPGVTDGRMMSSPALCYEGKVFAFPAVRIAPFGLGLRIPRQVDVAALALGDWGYLAPFKTKPPMKDWVKVGPADAARWAELVELALSCARNPPT